MTIEYQQRANELVEAGQQLYAMGMVPATSGNFSALLSDGSLAITVSGRHKGRLTTDDIMRVDATGKSLDGKKPSAETLLHVQIYNRFKAAGVVLHPHSVNATVLSRLTKNKVMLQDYELLKAFPGIDSHACKIDVPVFENDQDIARLSAQIERYMASYPGVLHGYLIAGHGFYTWGENLADALRHVEAFEFLFECELRTRGLHK
jgi:methylthioribulose-1-phosphate dehydratase